MCCSVSTPKQTRKQSPFEKKEQRDTTEKGVLESNIVWAKSMRDDSWSIVFCRWITTKFVQFQPQTAPNELFEWTSDLQYEVPEESRVLHRNKSSPCVCYRVKKTFVFKCLGCPADKYAPNTPKKHSQSQRLFLIVTTARFISLFLLKSVLSESQDHLESVDDEYRWE